MRYCISDRVVFIDAGAEYYRQYATVIRTSTRGTFEHPVIKFDDGHQIEVGEFDILHKEWEWLLHDEEEDEL